MKIVGEYRHHEELFPKKSPRHLRDVFDVIRGVDDSLCRTKVSKEKTMRNRSLLGPKTMNPMIINPLKGEGWLPRKIEYPDLDFGKYYKNGFQPKKEVRLTKKEIDLFKDRIALEIQFGKYAFSLYDITAKYLPLYAEGELDLGLCILAVNEMSKEMSTGVGYFEKVVADLVQSQDLVVPVMVLALHIG
jgi:hypothetical protein